jgi:hypothetical protein
MLDPATLGVWIATLKTAIDAGTAGAKAARELLKEAQDDDACLDEGQKGALNKLSKDATAPQLIGAVTGHIENAQGSFNQASSLGGRGGDAKSILGAATGGAGGSSEASAGSSGGTKRSGK